MTQTEGKNVYPISLSLILAPNPGVIWYYRTKKVAVGILVVYRICVELIEDDDFNIYVSILHTVVQLIITKQHWFYTINLYTAKFNCKVHTISYFYME